MIPDIKANLPVTFQIKKDVSAGVGEYGIGEDPPFEAQIAEKTWDRVEIPMEEIRNKVLLQIERIFKIRRSRSRWNFSNDDSNQFTKN